MDPSEAEVIRGAVVSWLADVHTSLPGTVLSYDTATQSAAVKPAVQRSTPRREGGWSHKDYPVIPNVRVAWLAAGGCSLQMPLAKDDAVWLLFSESCWAQYRRTGQVTPPGDERRFDLSYPVALPVALTAALRSVTGGPHVEVPSGKVMTVGGDPSGMHFVALENLVNTELNRVKADIGTLKEAVRSALVTVDWSAGSASTATFTSSTATIPSDPGSVAASKLKTG